MGLAISNTCFPCTTELRCSFKLTIGYIITSGPASLRISAACVLIAVRTAVERWNFRVVSDNLWHRGGPFNFTCIVISTSVSGAGLTSVVSCAAADVMSAPADWMEGCMRGASDSGLNVESGEGKVKELVETTASICSIDDCMILARVFSSVKASWDTLQRKAAVKHFNIDYV